MKTEAFLGEILNGIVTLLEPLAEALSDKESFEAFIERFGWQLGASATIESIEAALPDLKTTVEQLKKVAGQLKQGDLDASAISTLVGNGRPLVQKVLSIVNSIAGNTAAQFEPFNNPEFRKTFPSEVLQYLLYT